MKHSCYEMKTYEWTEMASRFSGIASSFGAAGFGAKGRFFSPYDEAIVLVANRFALCGLSQFSKQEHGILSLYK